MTLERPVAIKVLHSHIEEEPTLLERFRREARVVAGLRHANIVPIFDFDTTDGHPYIVMEYLKGPPLATYLRGLHGWNALIQPHQIARLLKALTAALDYAATQTASGMVSGTPAYMSPKQARGDKTDPRTDINSLGVQLTRVCDV